MIHDCVAFFAINASSFRDGRWPGRWRDAPRLLGVHRHRLGDTRFQEASGSGPEVYITLQGEQRFWDPKSNAQAPIRGPRAKARARRELAGGGRPVDTRKRRQPPRPWSGAEKYIEVINAEPALPPPGFGGSPSSEFGWYCLACGLRTGSVTDSRTPPRHVCARATYIPFVEVGPRG